MRRTSTLRRTLALTALAGRCCRPPPPRRTASRSRLPVALSQDAPRTSVAAGQLCRPSHPGRRASTVQLLIHGATYGKTYWDWPQQRYSYVRAALAAGYSTLAVDRLGVGETSRPASELVQSAEPNAFVLHQWIGALRAGRLRGVAFARVVSVGHSLGSALAVEESTTYHDVDALVLSGFLHSLGAGRRRCRRRAAARRLRSEVRRHDHRPGIPHHRGRCARRLLLAARRRPGRGRAQQNAQGADVGQRVPRAQRRHVRPTGDRSVDPRRHPGACWRPAPTTRCSAAARCPARRRARSSPTRPRTGRPRRAWTWRSCRSPVTT